MWFLWLISFTKFPWSSRSFSKSTRIEFTPVHPQVQILKNNHTCLRANWSSLPCSSDRTLLAGVSDERVGSSPDNWSVSSRSFSAATCLIRSSTWAWGVDRVVAPPRASSIVYKIQENWTFYSWILICGRSSLLC